VAGAALAALAALASTGESMLTMVFFFAASCARPCTRLVPEIGLTM
jgi:hypothetical protein